MRIQDSETPEPCCGPVRPLLAVCQPERRRLLLHPAPAPGGRAPSWVNVAIMPPRPQGQLHVPGVADLARMALRRAYERLEAGEAEVTIRDAVAILRLAHEIEHEDALAERDAARRQIAEWKRGLRLIRDAVVSHHGQPAWDAVAAQVNLARPDRR